MGPWKTLKNPGQNTCMINTTTKSCFKSTNLSHSYVNCLMMRVRQINSHSLNLRISLNDLRTCRNFNYLYTALDPLSTDTRQGRVYIMAIATEVNIENESAKWHCGCHTTIKIKVPSGTVVVTPIKKKCSKP